MRKRFLIVPVMAAALTSCQQQPQSQYENGPPRRSEFGCLAGTVTGAVVGGLIGSTIGAGSGQVLATAAGAGLGGFAGNRLTC